MKVIITDEIMGYMPYRTGIIDAKRGKPPSNCQVFVTPDSIVHYLLGYESITGSTPETQELIRQFDSPGIQREYTELEWQISYTDSREETWHWLSEEQIRVHLRASYYDVNSIMEVMRENPGKPIAGSAFAKFRHYKEE